MKRIITTEKAPAPIGPYNQAVSFGDMLFVSGQIAIDPKDGQLKIDDLKEETHLVMSNLKAVLEAGGSDFSKVIKTSIFLSNMDFFPIVNEIYGAYFESHFPARECVAVLTLPKHVNVEISAIAHR